MDEFLNSLNFNSVEVEEKVKVSIKINKGAERIVVNYALQQNREKFIKSLSVVNECGKDITDAVLRITCDPDFAFSFEKRINLAAESTVDVIPNIVSDRKMYSG